MSEIKDGGPAFPREDYQTDNASGQRGMSLRDYFAAQFLTSPCLMNAGADFDAMASRCYRVADAMLRAREAKS